MGVCDIIRKRILSFLNICHIYKIYIGGFFMLCPKCKKYISDDSEMCPHCGAELGDLIYESDDHDAYYPTNDKELFENIRVINAEVTPDLSSGSVKYKQIIESSSEFANANRSIIDAMLNGPTASESANIDVIRCPKCHSDSVQFVHETQKKGFRANDSCCGYILFGPLGLLCGAFGMNDTSTTEFWICSKCGTKFDNKDSKTPMQNYDMKTKMQMLISASDDTIDNIDSITSDIKKEISAMEKNLNLIKNYLNKIEEEEKDRNSHYEKYSTVNTVHIVITGVIALMGSALLFIIGLQQGFILALILAAAWFIGTVSIYKFINSKMESKICTPEYLAQKAELEKKSTAQEKNISAAKELLERVEKIKEAKNELAQRHLL